jgi:hypothetical protein
MRGISFVLLSLCLLLPIWFSVAAPDWKETIKKENGFIEELRQDIEIFVNQEGGLEILARVNETTTHFSDNANI